MRKVDTNAEVDTTRYIYFTQMQSVQHNLTLCSTYSRDFKWGLSAAYQIITPIMRNKPNDLNMCGGIICLERLN